jgi:hypothetical protein
MTQDEQRQRAEQTPTRPIVQRVAHLGVLMIHLIDCEETVPIT